VAGVLISYYAQKIIMARSDLSNAQYPNAAMDLAVLKITSF
jgi:hypothetical protein